jgi:hypothetical protein
MLEWAQSRKDFHPCSTFFLMLAEELLNSLIRKEYEYKSCRVEKQEASSGHPKRKERNKETRREAMTHSTRIEWDGSPCYVPGPQR